MQFVKENWIWLLAAVVLVVEGITFVARKAKQKPNDNRQVSSHSRSRNRVEVIEEEEEEEEEEEDNFSSFDSCEEEESSEEEKEAPRRRRRAQSRREPLDEEKEDDEDDWEEDEDELREVKEETEETEEEEIEEETEEPLISDNFISILMGNQQVQKTESEQKTEPEPVEVKQEPVVEQVLVVEQEPTVKQEANSLMTGLEQFKTTIKLIESEKLDLNNGNLKCDVSYEEGVRDKVVFTSTDFIFPLHRVFVNGHERKWNHRFEILFLRGDVIEIETGCKMKIPKGTRLKLFVPPEVSLKFGIDLDQTSITEPNRFDTECGVHAVFRAKKSGGYLAKYQDILYGTLEPVL